MIRKIVSLVFAMSLVVSAYSQIPRLTLYDLQANLMNPNIVRCSDGSGYLISASAVVNTANSQAAVSKVDPSGTLLWSQNYQLGGGSDMRCYGIVEHVQNGSFMLTGYYTDGGFRIPYVLEIDPGGNVIKAVSLDVCTGFYVSGPCHGYGLDLTVDINENVVVSGFADQGPLSMASNSVNGFVVQLDAGLNQNWTVQFNGVDNCPSMGNNIYHQYPMANRVVEVPGDGYFITGSVDDEQFFFTTPYQVQAVLSAMIDYNGNLSWKNPFSIFQNCGGGNDDFHVGADAIHDNGRIHLFSNFTNSHGFHYSTFNTANGAIGISDYYSPTSHYWAHTVLPDQHDPDAMIVAGVQHNNGATNYPFVANIDKSTGNVNWMYDYQVASNPPYLQPFGQTDNRLIPYFGGYEPFIEYPDMITTSDDGYVFVSNRVDGPGFAIAIDLFEIDGAGNLIGSYPGCSSNTVNLSDIAINTYAKQVDINPPFNNPEGNPGDNTINPQRKMTKCGEPLPPFESRKTSLAVENIGTDDGLKLYPNPINRGDDLTIEAPEDMRSMRILDVSGKEVLIQQETISISGGTIAFPVNLKAGVYFCEIITGSDIQRHKFVVSE